MELSSGAIGNENDNVTNETNGDFPQVHFTYAGTLQTRVAKRANKIWVVSVS